MVKVAVAGGTTGIGRAIVKALEKDGSHQCIILSRNVSNDSKVLAVDYSDPKGLQSALEEHEIHTVISAVSLQTEASGQSQLNLIEAADRSKATKRFMPSEFGAKYDSSHLAALPLYAFKFKAIELLEASSLEYTLFSNGLFMDYWFSPNIPSAFAFNAPSWVDLDNNFAAIPGNGDTPLVLTHSKDISRFVVKVLGLSRWEKRYYLIGDRLTLNDFLRIAEEIKGVTFERHDDTMATLLKGECTILPAVAASLPPQIDLGAFMKILAVCGSWAVDGGLDLSTEGTLNAIFPDIQTLTVREAIGIYFGQVNSS
ncbi:NAD(P)-binding protein [Aspergillus pseudonomiae]|nr:NAD(P)-binding protein [Aspergillus pseudonomiae]